MGDKATDLLLNSEVTSGQARFFAHRLKQIENKAGSASHYSKILSMIKKNPVMLTSQNSINGAYEPDRGKLASMRKKSQDLESVNNKQVAQTPIKVHKRSTSNLDFIDKTPMSFKSSNLSDEETAATPQKRHENPKQNFSIFSSVVSRKQAVA